MHLSAHRDGTVDQEALVGATRHNRPEVLEWWDKSGLPIQYRMCDIEEALEDAIGGGEDARLPHQPPWWIGGRGGGREEGPVDDYGNPIKPIIIEGNKPQQAP